MKAIILIDAVFKIILSIIVIITATTVVMKIATSQQDSAKTVNEALKQDIFQTECELSGTSACHGPDSDMMTISSNDILANERWDGCPQDRYIINYYGCNEPGISIGNEKYKYCCTTETPQKCELGEMRLCYLPELKDGIYDDGCKENCGQTAIINEKQISGSSECDYWIDATKTVGVCECDKTYRPNNEPLETLTSENYIKYLQCIRYCSEAGRQGQYCYNYGNVASPCCGKKDDRKTGIDCPKTHPFQMNIPCNNGGICCSK